MDNFIYRVKDHGIFDKILQDFMGPRYGHKPERPKVRQNQPLAMHQIQPTLFILALGYGSKLMKKPRSVRRNLRPSIFSSQTRTPHKIDRIDLTWIQKSKPK